MTKQLIIERLLPIGLRALAVLCPSRANPLRASADVCKRLPLSSSAWQAAFVVEETLPHVAANSSAVTALWETAKCLSQLSPSAAVLAKSVPGAVALAIEQSASEEETAAIRAAVAEIGAPPVEETAAQQTPQRTFEFGPSSARSEQGPRF